LGEDGLQRFNGDVLQMRAAAAEQQVGGGVHYHRLGAGGDRPPAPSRAQHGVESRLYRLAPEHQLRQAAGVRNTGLVMQPPVTGAKIAQRDHLESAVRIVHAECQLGERGLVPGPEAHLPAVQFADHPRLGRVVRPCAADAD
jgi:hypothetical protein